VKVNLTTDDAGVSHKLKADALHATLNSHGLKKLTDEKLCQWASSISVCQLKLNFFKFVLSFCAL